MFSESKSRTSSPTLSLEDIMKSLEDYQQSSETLVDRANDLVSLLQRHSVLKYDIVVSQLYEKYVLLLTPDRYYYHHFFILTTHNFIEFACFYSTNAQKW